MKRKMRLGSESAVSTGAAVGTPVPVQAHGGRATVHMSIEYNVRRRSACTSLEALTASIVLYIAIDLLVQIRRESPWEVGCVSQGCTGTVL